jgi:hypothetical protein
MEPFFSSVFSHSFVDPSQNLSVIFRQNLQGTQSQSILCHDSDSFLQEFCRYSLFSGFEWFFGSSQICAKPDFLFYEPKKNAQEALSMQRAKSFTASSFFLFSMGTHLMIRCSYYTKSGTFRPSSKKVIYTHVKDYTC